MSAEIGHAQFVGKPTGVPLPTTDRRPFVSEWSLENGCRKVATFIGSSRTNHCPISR